MDWTIVRPGEFATNGLLLWGPSIRMSRQVVDPFPDQPGQPIHEADIADVVVAGLADPQRRGRIDTIVGPETLTKREQVAAIASAIDEPISINEVSADEARDFYVQQGGFGAANADFLFGFESYDGVEGTVDQTHDAHNTSAVEDQFQTLDQVTGQSSRTYRQWARDHVADFSNPAGRGR